MVAYNYIIISRKFIPIIAVYNRMQILELRHFISFFTVPHFFSIAFSMIKPLLSDTTRDKMRIFDCDRSEWEPALLEEIDSDQLPACYGGSMTDPDGNPMCLTKVIDIIYIFNKKKMIRDC